MAQSVPSLKLEWQRVMEIMMRSETSYDKQQMEQDNQCEIKMAYQIEINVEQESKEFQLFYGDPRTGHSWITNLINQLSDVHLSLYHPIQSNDISPSQFINRLLATTTPTAQQSHSNQQSRQQFTSRQHEYVFFNSLPKESLIISTMQQIDDDCVMFVARSFLGQIVYVSLNKKQKKKLDILTRFMSLMRGRVLHVVIDSIDYTQGERGKLTQHDLIIISQSTNCIYLLRETDCNLASDGDNFVRYQIYYNSILHKYTHCSQFPYLQQTLSRIIQSLLQYFFTLMREELPRLHQAFYNELSLIKGVIQLNYNRRLQKQQNTNYELTQFQDFIHFHHYITQFMLHNSLHPTLFHFSNKLPLSTHCYYCKVYKNANKSTLYTCQRCQSEYNLTIPLCPECMEPFHQIKDRLKIFQNLKTFNKNSQKNDSRQKLTTQPCVGINLLSEQQKSINLRQQGHYKRSKHYISRLAGKLRSTKKISRLNKKKKLHLTSQQVTMSKQLQQSGQRLIEIFRQFNNLKPLYKPSIDCPTSQQELKYELKGQLDFMKAMGVELGRQIEMFEGEVVMAVYRQEGVEEDRGMVKIEHVEDGEQRGCRLPMVKIEQESNWSCDYDSAHCNHMIHYDKLRKSTALGDD